MHISLWSTETSDTWCRTILPQLPQGARWTIHLEPSFFHHCSSLLSGEQFITDNGPQFASCKCTDYTASVGIQHTTSSSLYPQANGFAKRWVQTSQRLCMGQFHRPLQRTARISWRRWKMATAQLNFCSTIICRQLYLWRLINVELKFQTLVSWLLVRRTCWIDKHATIATMTGMVPVLFLH